ncbi:hypothetical protein [Pseudobdellovibrio sp. HCB154]|uniref:hypothetical protein n=1 Tax=Pseudobdellovibrio sp. HCB154 TaxID=3386277 RepID=UPI003916E596
MINSQLLLYLNLGIGLLLVLYFLSGRHKPKQPTRLNMRAKGSAEKVPVVLEAEGKQEVAVTSGEPREVGRSLAVMFMYNGHDWEAHDVLGVPQGASMHQVTMVYQELVKKSDARSLQFYEHAYAAISTRHRKHRL